MPREKKGNSSKFLPRKERLPIEIALLKLHSLLTDVWKIDEVEYVLVDELAYVLQGYEVLGTEMESGHIDVYVNPTVVPWLDKGERSIIPPKDSQQMNEWINFMTTTGYGLDMLRAKPEFLTNPTVKLSLPNGNIINLMRAYEMTKLFVEQTIMHYSLEDVGQDKIREWINKLVLIKNASLKKGDDILAGFCEDKLAESRKKWSRIL